jgi:hypothetical protein
MAARRCVEALAPCRYVRLHKTWREFIHLATLDGQVLI